MKSASFEFARPTTVEQAIELALAAGPDARYMSGGQSLMPVLALRIANPSLVIDLTKVSALKQCVEEPNAIVMGALTTYREAQASPLLRQWVPLLQEALPHIAHEAIRNAGTLGGSVALADPAAEMPAVCVALGASIQIASASGTRWVPAVDFFQGLYQTALSDGELVTAISFPKAKAEDVGCFMEIARRRGDYATAGLAVWVRRDGSHLGEFRACLFGVSSKPVLLTRQSEAMRQCIAERASPDALLSKFSSLRQDVEFFADMNNSIEMKQHLAQVLLARATQKISKALS